MSTINTDTDTGTGTASTATTTIENTTSNSPSSPSSSAAPPAQPAPPTSTQQLCTTCSQPPSSSHTTITSTTSSNTLKSCPRCHSTFYCSRACQKADQKRHKKVCAAAAQIYAQTADFKPQITRAVPGEGRRRGLQKWQFDT